LLHHLSAALAAISDALVAIGPWGVFLLGVLDSAGIPLPNAMDFLLILVAVKSPDHAYFTALMAILGSVGGNITLFLMARHGVRRFVKPPQPGKPQKFREWFRQYGLVTVFIPCLLPIPMPLKVFVVSAGMLHTPLADFLGVIVVARVIRYFGEAYLGIRLGRDAQAYLNHNAWTMICIALVLAFALIAIIRLNEQRRRAAQQ
jgi:membrane protein YqaA with SNARE-associated domain